MGEVTGNGANDGQTSRNQAAAQSSVQALPPQSHEAVKWVAPPWSLPKAPPHTIYSCLLQGVKAALPNTQKQTPRGCQIEETKKYDPNEEQNKTPEKELNEMEIANLAADAEFKTLVIRMLQELIEYGNNIKEEMKIILTEIKKNLQGTNSKGKEAGVQINDLNIRKK